MLQLCKSYDIGVVVTRAIAPPRDENLERKREKETERKNGRRIERIRKS